MFWKVNMLNIMEGKVGKVNLPMKSSLDRWSLSQTVTSRVCPAKSCVIVLSKQQHKKTMLRQKEKFMKEMCEEELQMQYVEKNRLDGPN